MAPDIALAECSLEKKLQPGGTFTFQLFPAFFNKYTQSFTVNTRRIIYSIFAWFRWTDWLTSQPSCLSFQASRDYKAYTTTPIAQFLFGGGVVHTQGSQRSDSGTMSQETSILFFWDFRLGGLASEPQGSACLCLPKHTPLPTATWGCLHGFWDQTSLRAHRASTLPSPWLQLIFSTDTQW